MAKADNKPKRHIPQRTCVGCREINEKKTMTRIVKTPDGICVDESGRLPGRGAYLHDSRECWEKALKRGALARALKTEISPDELQKLQAYAEALPENE